MVYARINLQKTNYQLYPLSKRLYPPHDIKALNEIYTKYCRYKKFKSVMPIFDSEFNESHVHGYYDFNGNLIAFSLIKVYDNENAEAKQFAWNYEDPKLELGIKSLKHECAFYKVSGFKYLYLGGADKYKSKIDGYEILGPI